MGTIKAGIIGCGGIANQKHLPSIKETGRVEVVAFCDIIPERAEKSAAEFGTPSARVYTDYKELLKGGAGHSLRLHPQPRMCTKQRRCFAQPGRVRIWMTDCV